ncbi:Ig domain-containing protein [Paenibacillus aurantiacus]|uniref:Ig domain-containing protein n=1 Tax=Paenibacillus aurantiacus TaxID=1936118 RepID=A0ABV5KSC9_9BACL
MRKPDKQSKAGFNSRSAVSALLAFVMMLTLMSGMAFAADETVTGLQFEDSYPTTMYVSNGTMAMNVLATVSSSTTTKKDVTSSATWTSSNPAVIKVTGGTLTALTTGTAKISAQYSGFKVSLDMTSEYMYDSVTIKQDGSAASDSLNLNIGDDLEFTLAATKGSTVTDDIADATWTSSDASVASVDGDGVVTLIAAGTTTITASYKGRKDTVKLTVASPYKELKIDGDSIREFKVGNAAIQLTATATKASGGTDEVEDEAAWTTSSAGVVTVEDGKITPVAPGKATITATYLGVTASVTVVVRPAFEAMRITPSDTQHILINGNGVQFKVSIPENNVWKEKTTEATWTSSDIYAATVDSSGKVTPKEIGSTTITATYKGLVKSVLVHVYPTINTMKASKETVDAFVDEAVTLPKITATSLADEEFVADDLVTWTTSDTTVVDLKDDAWIGKKVGEAKLTAAIGDKSVEVSVKVSEKPLALMSETTNLSLVIGKEADLPAIKVINESGSEEDVTSKVTWKASSANLLLKAPKMKGLVKSNVTLTATYLGKSITFKVTIEEELAKLFIDASNVTLTIGKTKAFKVTGVYKSGQSVTLSTKMNWSLNSETTATVNSNIVKGLAEGTVTLTGTYQSKTVTATIAVKPKLLKLIVSEKSFTMAPGSAKTFKVTAEYENGKSIDVTKAAVWTSSKAATAAVSDGTVIALAKGTATIKVAYEGKTATIRVTVKP